MSGGINISSLILENLSEPILVLNKEYQIEFCNQAASELLSQQVPDWLIEEVEEFFANQSLARNLEKEINIQEKTIHLQVFLKLMVSPEPEFHGILIVLKDITKQKEAERSFKQVQKHMCMVMQNMPILMDAYDDKGNIVLWNTECERVTGYSAKEVIGNPKAAELLYPDQAYRQYMLRQIVEYGDRKREWEWEITCKNGEKKTIYWYNLRKESCVPQWVLAGFGIDITEQKEVEKKLRQTTSTLSAVLHALPDLYFRLDSNGVILHWEAGSNFDLYGNLTVFPGQKITDVFPSSVSYQYEQAIQQVFQTKSLVLFEYSISLDKEEKFLEARLVPLSEKQIIVIVRDITQRKRMENELLRIEKLNSIGILAGGLAHDFNNILTIILGNVFLAKRYEHTDQRLAKKLLGIEEAALQAKNLTQQLLTFAKGGIPVKAVISIKKLIQESTSLALSGSSVLGKYSLAENLWTVEVDEGQISQVVNNLILNAIQAMPNGGVVEIKAENIILEEGHHLPLDAGSYVKISIVDQGTGIDKESISKIFDPYFTTKPKGIGLGLATVYSIINKHSGYITVDSEMGVGTNFSFYLPASFTREINKQETREKLIAGKGKILIMDDEMAIRKLLGEMLISLGYEVKAASDGLEAIGFYQEFLAQGKPFDGVIMDLTIPGGMGGQEAIKGILAIDPEAKVIVSSGYSENPVMANYQHYGFRGYMSKPYTIEQLSKVISEVVST